MNKKSFVSGKSIEDILNLNISKLTDKEIRQVTTRLVSAANKRVRRMESAGEESPALKSVKRSGGKFSTKGKSAAEVKQEFKRAKKFLSAKTSTLRDYKKTKSRKKPTTKKPKQKTSDLLQKDVSKMNEKELRKATQTLMQTARKRVKRLKDQDINTPALQNLEEGGSLTTKGKKLNELRGEFKRLKNFLNNESSTVKGWKTIQKSTIDTLKTEYGISLNRNEWDTFWRAYEELKKTDPSIAVRGFKYNTLKEINKIVSSAKNATPGEIAGKVGKRLEQIYEEEQSINDRSGVSQFIEW